MVADIPPDRIHIRDLTIRCIIGLYPEERREKQDVIVNLVLEADLRAACQSDRLEDTVDYKGLKKRIVAMMESSSRFLIERLAEDIAELCLTESKIERVTVSLDKPGALRFARSVAVEITRARHA